MAEIIAVGVAAVATAPTLVSANKATLWVVVLTLVAALGGPLTVLGGVAGFQVLRAPYRQRDEARDDAADLRAEFQKVLEPPPFPRSEIEIKPFFYLDFNPTSDFEFLDEERIFVFEVRATNREPKRRVNLSFEIEVVRSPRQEPPIKGRFFRSSANTKKRFDEEVLPEIVDIGPGRTVKGFLKLSEGSAGIFLTCEKEGNQFAAIRDHILQAVVRDHITAQEAVFELPGKWSS